MKTLEEMWSLARGYAGTVAGLALGNPDMAVVATQQRHDLFASLAAWDAVLQEALPGLQVELEGLKALRDTHECPNDKWDTYSWNTVEGYVINTSGLTRLEHLRKILGEEE